jgi:excisionase family DNA binding protein
VTGRPLLSAAISGPSAWIVHQLLAAPLKHRIEQLQRDPHVPRRVVDDLQGTAAAIQEAARQYKELVESSRSEVADSVEQPRGGSGGALENPLNGWVDVGEVAAVLNCSARWVTALCQQGRLAATKRGRSWRIDASSVEDFMLRGADAA